jgi:hypothetical protein
MARMPAAIFTDYRPYSPSRSPHWRWECAVGYLQNDCGIDAEEDQTIRGATGYLRQFDAACTLSQKAAVQRRYPTLTAAMNLFDAPSPQTWELRARLLTDQTNEQIAQTLGLDLRVVDVFERLFFDVRTNGRVRGMDRIVLQIFSGFDAFASVPEQTVWLYFALAGGAPVLDLLIGDYLGRPDSQHPDRHLLAELARLLTREHGAFIYGEFELSARLVLQCYDLIRDRTNEDSADNRLLLVYVDILRLAAKLPLSTCRRKVRALPAPTSHALPAHESDVSEDALTSAVTTS